ncbi:hypothetical protein QAD02_005289 [Eretmocerus hayati]|uniref:Uncharacterized protein n=1 Tax=Eretmocerus hayati TaxID=131215 RepID=A0ACC2NSG2_9HYME|nr:hypothetical protein QAD02_005289 [Eretmocerus hayati]
MQATWPYSTTRYTNGINYIPNYSNGQQPKKTSTSYNANNNRITSETAENVALVIGIIAGALIAIVLIILLILKFKGRPEINYKVDEGKGFCVQDPNAALLGGGSGAAGVAGAQAQIGGYNGALKNGQSVSKNGRGKGSKDIKEWYV